MRRKSLSTEKGNATMNPIWYPQKKRGGEISSLGNLEIKTLKREKVHLSHS